MNVNEHTIWISDIGCESGQQHDKTPENHHQKGIKGKFLPPRDALREESTVVVQSHYTNSTLHTVIHLLSTITITLTAVHLAILLILLVRDAPEVADTGVEELCEEEGKVNEEDDTQVDDEELVLVCL